MDILKVPYLNTAPESDIQQLSLQLNELTAHDIKTVLWPTSSYKPEVQFTIGYSDDAIILKYSVQENHLRACYTIDNSPVHLDSCVEFFLSFNNEKTYYNLEFNCLGTCLVAFGENKVERELVPVAITSNIKRHTTIKNFVTNGSAKAQWELTVVIPLTTFVHHQLHSLKGLQIKGNFFKCGDALAIPHYLSWKEIKSDTPNFHLPEFFGCMQFE